MTMRYDRGLAASPRIWHKLELERDGSRAPLLVARPRAPKRAMKKKSAPTPPARPFQLVWSIVERVPPGRVVTYGQLAEMIHHRLSPVGVGWAIRAAPEDSI